MDLGMEAQARKPSRISWPAPPDNFLLAPSWHEARRLTAGSIGPVAVAGTQFAASMLLWNSVSAAAFGLFSLGIVLIQLSFGLSNALIGTPLSVAPRDSNRSRHRNACLSAHALYMIAAAIGVPAILWLAGAGWNAVAFSALTVAANLRWAARSFALADEKVSKSAISDGAYAAVAMALLGATAITHSVTIDGVTFCLIAANLVTLLASSRDFLGRQIAAVRRPDIDWYRREIWRKQAGWSVVGVMSTEASSNAHAYIVTWQSGAAVFAPLAFGSLFCRPLTIFLTALNQIDRPIFARHLHADALDRIRGLLRINFVSVGLIWLGNLGLAMILLEAFAGKIASRGYDIADVRHIVLIWFAIVAMRAVRNPIATLLQASGAFRYLAFCSLASSMLSVTSVWWLATRSPIFSLFGILCGEALLLGLVAFLYRQRLR